MDSVSVQRLVSVADDHIFTIEKLSDGFSICPLLEHHSSFLLYKVAPEGSEFGESHRLW